MPVNPETAPVIASEAISETAATASETACRFYVPNLVALFTDEVVSDDCTPFAELVITQSIAAGTEISGTTNVMVTVKDNCGNETSKTVSVTVPAKPTTPVITKTDVLCNGGNTGTATVTNVDNNCTYYWNTTPAQTGAEATSLTAGFYTVTVEDANHCTAMANVTISEPTKMMVSAGTTASNAQICAGEKTNVYCNVYGGTSAYHYAWNTGVSGDVSMGEVEPTTTTDYIVTVSDNNGCTAKDTVKVTVNPLPAVTIAAVDPICENATATLVATVSNMTDVNYQWSGSSSTTNTADYTVAGTYTVRATNNTTNCYAEATAVVSAYPAFTVGAINGGSETICQGGTPSIITTAGAAAGGHGTITYQWYLVTGDSEPYTYTKAEGTSNGETYDPVSVC